MDLFHSPVCDHYCYYYRKRTLRFNRNLQYAIYLGYASASGGPFVGGYFDTVSDLSESTQQIEGLRVLSEFTSAIAIRTIKWSINHCSAVASFSNSTLTLVQLTCAYRCKVYIQKLHSTMSCHELFINKATCSKSKKQSKENV